MQNKKRNLYRSDLRPPLIICAVIGAVLLLGFLVVACTVPRVERIRTYGFLLLTVYLLTVGAILPMHLKASCSSKTAPMWSMVMVIKAMILSM